MLKTDLQVCFPGLQLLSEGVCHISAASDQTETVGQARQLSTLRVSEAHEHALFELMPFRTSGQLDSRLVLQNLNGLLSLFKPPLHLLKHLLLDLQPISHLVPLYSQLLVLRLKKSHLVPEVYLNRRAARRLPKVALFNT